MPKRTRVLTVRLTDNEKELVKQVAHRLRMSQEEFVRACISYYLESEGEADSRAADSEL